ncbi:hypothetical protein PCE1_004770 [Barthelona sp. PCE]
MNFDGEETLQGYAIVSKHFGLTLVELDTQETDQLLLYVLEIVKNISEDYHQILEHASGEERSGILQNFLKICGYQHKSQTSLSISPETPKETVMDILVFLLNNAEDLKETVYEHQYFRKIEVPPQYIHDPNFAELMEQIQELQTEFKDLRTQYVDLESKHVNLIEVQDAISVRNDAIEHQSVVVENSTKELNQLGINQDLIGLCSQFEELTHSRQKYEDVLSNERSKLKLQEDFLDGISEKLKTYQMEEVIPLIVMKDLSDDVEQMLLKEGELRQKTIDKEHVEKVASNATDGTVEALMQEIRQLQNSVSSHSINSEQHQQLNTLKKHDATLTQKIEKLDRQIDQVVGKLSMAEKKLQNDSGSTVTLQQELQELKKYASENTKRYHAVKHQKTVTDNELSVLDGTLDTLRSIVPNADQHLRDRLGDRSDMDHIKQQTLVKNRVDEEKVEKLQQLTFIVQELRDKIKSKEDDIMPYKDELKRLKQEESSLLNDIKQREQVFESILGDEMLDDVRTDLTESQQVESSFHFLNILHELQEVKQTALEVITNFPEKLEKYAKRTEMETRELRTKKNNIEENYDMYALQSKYWNNTVGLLATKLNYVQSQEEEVDDVQQHRTNEADRLMINKW